MKLPQINNIQERTATLPLSGKVFKYRPYLVKEEKILLTASESGESSDIIPAIRQIVQNCTFGDINPDKISLVDLTYIMIKVRGASRGDKIDIGVKCKKCDHLNGDIIADLTATRLEGEVGDPVVKLTDESGITLKVPGLKDITALIDSTSTASSIYDTIANSIVSIYHKDELYSTDEISRDELDEFIDTLTDVQIGMIEKFFTSLPKLVLDIEFICDECGNKEKLTMENIMSFFV